MNRIKTLLCITFFYCGLAQADEFQPVKVLSRMTAAADWQLSHPFVYGELQWHCAPFYMGLSDLSEVSGDSRYLDAVKAIGEKNEWRFGNRIYHADDHAMGQAYLKLYQRDGDPAMIAKMQQQFDGILAKPAPAEYTVERKMKNGKMRRVRCQDRWSWCDALYMAPATWTGLWKVTGEQKYLDFMVKEWKQTTEWLWDDEVGLYYRDQSYMGKKTPAGKKIFWARGDGWVFGGLVEVLQYLPEDHSDRPYFVDKFKRMAATLKSIQKPNGTWAPSLLDPLHTPQDETSGTAFFTYGLAWGINNGLLDCTEYEPVARKGWQGLCDRQQDDGRLINIQPVGAHPTGFDPNNTSIYGMGAFLCAGSEIYKLIGGKVPAQQTALITFMKDGGWCWYQDPRVIIHNGKLIVGGVSGQNGDVKVSVYDLKNRTNLGTTILHEKFQRDDHDTPAFYVRPDGRILAIYAKHGHEKIHYFRVSDPVDYLKWGEERQIKHTYPERPGVTYMNLFTTQDDGLLYNFFRTGRTWNPAFITSTDHGETWSTETHFIKDEVNGRQRPYARYLQRDANTIGVSFTEGHPRNFGNSLYYADFRDGVFYKVDGTKIKAIADGPLTPAEAEKIYQGGGKIRASGQKGGSADQSAWTCATAVDAQHNPYLGYTLYLSNTDHRYRTAVWTGSRWIDREIAFAGTCLYPRESSYTGLLAFDPADPAQVFISTDVDPSTGKTLGGKHEIYTATIRAEEPIHWTPVTAHSTERNIRPIVVSNEGYTVLLWLNGPWHTFTDYASDVVGEILKTP